MRILFDSNVWLAILTTDGRCRQMWRLARGHSRIHTSSAILDEIEEKLRDKFTFHPRHVQLLTAFVRQQTICVHVSIPPPKVCRDPDDDHVLAAAASADCAYLVTGDKDLLALKSFVGFAIVTPREFAERIASA